MWNRALLKEEAKKVFTFKANYWKFVLAALIIVVFSGGVSGAVSGISSGLSGVLRSMGDRTHPNRYEYRTNNVAFDVDAITTAKRSDRGAYIDEDEVERYIEEGRFDEYLDKYVKEYGLENGDFEYDYDYDYGYDYDVEPYYNKEPYKYRDSSSEWTWGVVLIVILISLVISAAITAVSLAIKAFLVNPILLGTKVFFLKSYERPSNLRDLFHGFKNSYIKNVLTLFLRDLFTLLWSLLFIVPGIIKAYEYRQIPYLIAEDPNMGYKEAFARSKEMMMGNKWDAFVLDLSFLGWFLLNALTCGILGVFYVNPYYYATDANLYRAIKMGGSTGYASMVSGEQINNTVSVPQDSEVVSEPQNNDVVSEPQNNDVVSEPQDNDVVSEPQDNDDIR